MREMPAKIFVFVQLEVPFALGPPDGRYLMREEPGAEPAHILVLRSEREATTQATVIDAVALSAEQQARAWLDALDEQEELSKAVARLNQAILAYRIASANPAVQGIAAEQAERIAIGWGTGEQVADGRFSEAREVAVSAAAPGRRLGGLLPPKRTPASVRRPHERFAALLGARDEALLSEELTLRARADLEAGRLDHAAIELERAYWAALSELASVPEPQPGGGRGSRRRLTMGIADRVAELRRIYPDVLSQAQAVFPGGPEDPGTPADLAAGGEGHTEEARRVRPTDSGEGADGPDPEVLAQALARLEAALRARAVH
jgi:hypothetical protein